MNILQAMTKFDQFNQVVIRVDIRNRIWYQSDEVDLIMIGIDVYGIFIVFAFVTDSLIQISTCISSLDILTTVFNVIALNSNQKSIFECDLGNNGQSTAITNNFYKIHATPILISFFVNNFYFILYIIKYSITNRI